MGLPIGIDIPFTKPTLIRKIGIDRPFTIILFGTIGIDRFFTILFYNYFSRTSAVSLTNFRSILIFANCVVGTRNILYE